MWHIRDMRHRVSPFKEIGQGEGLSIIEISMLHTAARVHSRADAHIPPEIDPTDTKGHPNVTRECGAISRHRSPQFNTRLRLQRVTAVNFRSRPIYRMHVILACVF